MNQCFDVLIEDLIIISLVSFCIVVATKDFDILPHELTVSLRQQCSDQRTFFHLHLHHGDLLVKRCAVIGDLPMMSPMGFGSQFLSFPRVLVLLISFPP